MTEKRTQLEDMIREELEREAEDIRSEIEEMEEQDVPGEVKERIRSRLQEQIEDYEWERRYPDMSEEDRRALRLGREMLSKGAEDTKHVETGSEKAMEKDTASPDAGETGGSRKAEITFAGRKRGARFYLLLAAAVITALAVGITSFGGPERIVQLVKGVVGDREITKVTSGEDNIVIVEENQEEAYQVLSEELGIEPVKIMGGPYGFRFRTMEFDKVLQLAQLNYSYKNENIVYLIGVSFNHSSWGIDIEDKEINEYSIEKRDCMITVKEYETPETFTKRYSANFSYRGIEYVLIGSMEKQEFEKILNNLHFFN